jgi:hypothetical protein
LAKLAKTNRRRAGKGKIKPSKKDPKGLTQRSKKNKGLQRGKGKKKGLQREKAREETTKGKRKKGYKAKEQRGKGAKEKGKARRSRDKRDLSVFPNNPLLPNNPGHASLACFGAYRLRARKSPEPRLGYEVLNLARHLTTT